MIEATAKYFDQTIKMEKWLEEPSANLAGCSSSQKFPFFWKKFILMNKEKEEVLATSSMAAFPKKKKKSYAKAAPEKKKGRTSSMQIANEADET